MLIGDYELSDMRDAPAITILFVIFTVIGVVILLNVLIAVVSDSYEKATISSSLLFGSGRVIFVAQNEALESMLKPDTTPLPHSSRLKNVCTALYRLFCWIALLAILATAIDCEVSYRSCASHRRQV
jgi:Ion transport protein